MDRCVRAHHQLRHRPAARHLGLARPRAASGGGQATAEAEALLKDRAGLERAIGRSEAELVALPRHRPAGAVQAELRAAEVQAGVNCGNPRSRAVRESCAPVLTLRAEVAAAEDAARIEEHLEQLRAQLSGRAMLALPPIRRLMS